MKTVFYSILLMAMVSMVVSCEDPMSDVRVKKVEGAPPTGGDDSDCKGDC